MIVVNSTYSLIACTKEPAELIPAFMAELARLQSPSAELFKGAADEALTNEEQPELAEELVSSLKDELSELAGDGLYFGSHCDDDTDFGFWPSDELAFEMAA